ncbi:MAG: hypothetical protein LBD53_05460 [Tannerella sp.]|nr:hypothetical protein [Tannerella sp.]
MTVPRTLAVVLNPASGLELTSVIGRNEAIQRKTGATSLVVSLEPMKTNKYRRNTMKTVLTAVRFRRTFAASKVDEIIY